MTITEERSATAPRPRYDPFSPDVIENPYPWFRWLRNQSPCHYVKGRDVFVVTRAEDVRAIVRDPAVFSSAQGLGGHGAPAQHDLATTDPPEHGRLRKMVSRYFAPKEMAEVEAWTRRYIAELLPPVLEAGSVDWVQAVARPLPTGVIAHMLGIPTADWELFADWADAVVALIDGHLTGEERQRLEAKRDECKAYLRATIAERRARPQEDGIDVISVLLSHRDEGALSDRELLSFCLLLLVAGLETTRNAASNGLHALFEHPDQHRRLSGTPHLIPDAIEEVIRFDAPIQCVSRVTMQDTEIAGVAVPERSRVLVFFGSANRDERAFEQADTFVIDRAPRGHLGFGAGPHTCLGAPVTRMELRILGEEIDRRVRRILPDGPPERTTTLISRGFERLPVQVVPR
jgi:cytochrome P450